MTTSVSVADAAPVPAAVPVPPTSFASRVVDSTAADSAPVADITPAGRSPMAEPAVTHLDLLRRSGASLSEACQATASRERYLKAHLAALRAAAAYLAMAPSGPSRRSRRPVEPPSPGPGRGLWETLAASAPELREWASYFAATGARARRILRSPVLAAGVSNREADDLVRSAEAFIDTVAGLLGVSRRAGPVRLTPVTR